MKQTTKPHLLVLAQNFSLAGQFASRQVFEDPISLVLNVVRKLPYRLSQKTARLLTKAPGAGSQALGQQILGAQELSPAAQKLLTQKSGGYWSLLQQRIASEVAISYGVLDYHDENLPVAVRARTAWDRGALTEAMAIAASSSKTKILAHKLRGEAQVLEPGWTPQPHLTSQKKPVAARRVLHLLTNSLPHTQSGYTLRSHRLLLASAQRGLSLEALTRTGYPILIGQLLADRQDSVDGILYRRILPPRLGKTLPLRLEQAAEMLAKNLQEGETYPVLHTTTNYHNGVVMAGLARALNLPWVYEVRGIMEETWVSRHKTEKAQQEAEASERFAKIRAKETELMLTADHVVTLSQTMKNLLVERGVEAEKITLLPNAVADELFEHSLDSVTARAQLGLPAEGFWVGTVSSLVGYEGLDYLLGAVAAARASGQDVRALIAGDGVARPGLEALADELGIADHVYFLGRLPSHQAPLAHQALDIFCVPRTSDRVCRSVTPLKPIEAMALRRPVIMSDIPPLAELVDNGVTGPTGLLVEPENSEALVEAIVELLENPQEREKLAVNGRAFARTRTWSHNAQILEDVYAQLAQKKREA